MGHRRVGHCFGMLGAREHVVNGSTIGLVGCHSAAAATKRKDPAGSPNVRPAVGLPLPGKSPVASVSLKMGLSLAASCRSCGFREVRGENLVWAV